MSMWYLFFLQNIHFSLNVFAALVTFAVGWLYLDAWQLKKSMPVGLRVVGFFLLAFSFLIHATNVESTLMPVGFLSETLQNQLMYIVTIPGYVIIIISLLLDPIQPKPAGHSLEETLGQITPVQPAPSEPAPGLPALGFVANTGMIMAPFLSGLAGGLYWHRATTGLERHLRPVAMSFFLIGLSGLLSIPLHFPQSMNVDVFRFLDTFGPLWIASHVFFLIGIILLCRWVFGYLLKRFETQLFMLFTIIVVCIYLLTAVTFTALLVGSLKKESLSQLETNTKVLAFAIESKRLGTVSDAEVVSIDARVIDALVAKDRRPLADLLGQFVRLKKQNHLAVVNASGQVIALGEDTEQFGQSLAENPLVKHALSGKSSASVVTREGATTPEIGVWGVAPIRREGAIIGAVVLGSSLDNAFLDGIKKATGLEASLYASNTLSATTMVASDGVTRPIGIQDQNLKVLTEVTGGNSFSGAVTLLNRPYFSAYLPLQDADNNFIGMLMVARPQSSVLVTAGKSIQMTFLVTVALLVLSVVPAYMIARYISKQI
jgi:hypothetical protein